MNTVRGIYRGPQQAITLEGRDYTLTPGAEVELPKCEYVDGLVACQLLGVGDYQAVPAPVVVSEPPVAPVASTTDEATGAEEPRPAPAKPPKAADKKEVKR